MDRLRRRREEEGSDSDLQLIGVHLPDPWSKSIYLNHVFKGKTKENLVEAVIDN